MNENEILTESQRCLNCANPRCKASCPLGVNIPRMIEYFKNGKIKEAYEIDFESNPFGLICGLICPHEKQCEGACVRGLKEQPVSIGQIEHSICKVALDSFHKGGFYSPAQSSIKQIDTSQKVAIIGGGPAGLSCAHELSKANIKSTIFEKESFLGGILMYGIPDFRLDKKLVNKAIDNILNNNIEVIYGTEYCEKGETALNIAKLKEKGYKYIFISTGLEANKTLEIPGISSKKVLYANEYLREYYENGDLKSESKKIAVIGGGNVAIDTARVAKKLGNDVTIVYRKTRERMPANKDEVEAAINEGVKFIFETNVLKIDGQDNLKLYLDSIKEIEVDNLIIAIGSSINKKDFKEELINSETGLMIVNENFETRQENIFAGGDIINNKGTVASAIRDGICVAKIIIEKEKT